MKPQEKAIEIAENANLPVSKNETDETIRALHDVAIKGYIKTAVRYGALQMYEWTKEQYLSADFILEVLRINSNITDRSNPRWIAEQIAKQLKNKIEE